MTLTSDRPAPRERVLAAAQDLFLQHGYVATTIGGVARQAGVALNTIYSGYGGKVGLLSAVQDRALAGDGEAVPLLERAWVAELDSMTPHAALTVVVERLTAATERAAAVLGVITAAAADPAVGKLLERLHDQRVRTCTELAARITGHAAPERTRRLSDGLYALLGVEAYTLLVIRRGWDRAEWSRFVERSLLPEVG